MVHGYEYGVQYEIHLSKPLDLYDDILPICSHVRSMLEYDAYKQKIIVINSNKLSNRHYDQPLFNNYRRCLNDAHYVHFNKETYIKKLNGKEEEWKEIEDFINVSKYYRFIKHSNIKVVSVEELLVMKEMYEKMRLKCDEMDRDESIKFNELKREIEIQMLVIDQEYFNKIMELERELCNVVKLKQEELDLIKRVEMHPKLEGIISYSGLELTEGYY